MLRNWKKDFITNASHVFEGNKQAKEARRKEDSLKKEKDQMLKTIGQLTLERNFLQGCFHQCGREVPRLDSEDV
jgi:putative transposase